MAIVKNGVNGSVSGKVGSVVFCKWKDKNYVRSRPRIKKNKKPTTEQQYCRSKFKLVQRTLRQITFLLRTGFKQVNQNLSAYSNAMSYTLKEATLETENGFLINWDKFLFSKGKPNPITAWQIDIVPEKNVCIVSWQYDRAVELKHDLWGYQCRLLFYPEEEDKPTPPINAYQRYLRDCEQEISLHEIDEQADYHVHIAFTANDGSDHVTDSKYLGKYRLADLSAGS